MTDDTSAYAAAARAQMLIRWAKERDLENIQKMIDGLSSVQRGELAIAVATIAAVTPTSVNEGSAHE
jgi:ribosomal protein S11